MARTVRKSEEIGAIRATLDIHGKALKVIQDDQRELRNRQENMNEILAANVEQLKIHIEGVRLIREQNELMRREFDAKIAPLEGHVTRVNFGAKIGLFLIGLPACVYYTFQIIRFIRG